MKIFKNARLSAFVFLGTFFFLPHTKLFAGENSFAFGGAAGLPHLLAFDVRYVGFDNLEFGVGLGSLPLNSYLQSHVPLTAVDVDLQQPDPYRIYPTANFAMTGFTPYVRFYVQKDGRFFLQVSYSIWRFNSTLNGDLQNETTLARSIGVVTGSLIIHQPVVTPAVGWRFKIGQNLNIETGVGASFLSNTEARINVGGSIENIITVVPEAEEDFNAAVATIRDQLNSGVATFRESVKFLPALFLGVSLEF